MYDWIKASDALPPDNKEVLIYHNTGKESGVFTATHKNNVWVTDVEGYEGKLLSVSHWMEIPEHVMGWFDDEDFRKCNEEPPDMGFGSIHLDII